MGHVTTKDGYRRLQSRLDQMPVGARPTPALFEILKELYSEDEAELGARLPLRPTPLAELVRRFQLPEKELKQRLDRMAQKGLVFDFGHKDQPSYMLTPTVVGFFEFSMMRVRPDLDQRRLAHLYHEYVIEEGLLHATILGEGKTSLFRPLVHEETLPQDYREVMDWERASHVVGEAGRWAVGLCHCRHVALHRDEPCAVLPLEVCLSIGPGADYVTRHGMARDIAREEALDILDKGRDAGAVFLCDNVQQRPTFLCICCGCCCEVLVGFKKFAPNGDTMSSNFLATIDEERCRGCGKCAKACPIDGIDMVERPRKVNGRSVRSLPTVDENLCLGCGVCGLSCKRDALQMSPRERRNITPASTLSRILNMAIEQDKLHHLLVDNEAGLGSQVAGALLGAILRLPPAKQVLTQKILRSRLVDYWLRRQKLPS